MAESATLAGNGGTAFGIQPSLALSVRGGQDQKIPNVHKPFDVMSKMPPWAARFTENLLQSEAKADLAGA